MKRKLSTSQNRIIIMLVTVLCLTFLALSTIDIIHNRERSLTIYSTLKEEEGTMLMRESTRLLEYSEKPLEEILITIIQDSYVTSASSYCFVAVDDRIIFLRDERKTSLSLQQFLDLSSDKLEYLDYPAKNTIHTVLGDNQKYVISLFKAEQDGKTITLGICTRTDYIVKRYEADLLIQHILLYNLLLIIGFVTAMFYLMRQNKNQKDTIHQITDEMVRNRKLIEVLNEESDNQSNQKLNDKNSGFLTKNTVEEMLQILTREQKKKCTRIVIEIESWDVNTLVQFAIMLERIKIRKSVSCLWKDGEFLVILLNCNQIEVENYVKQLQNQYENEFQDKVANIRFRIEQL